MTLKAFLSNWWILYHLRYCSFLLNGDHFEQIKIVNDDLWHFLTIFDHIYKLFVGKSVEATVAFALAVLLLGINIKHSALLKSANSKQTLLAVANF